MFFVKLTLSCNVYVILVGFSLISGFIQDFCQSNICFVKHQQDVIVYLKMDRHSEKNDAKTLTYHETGSKFSIKIVQGTLWRRSGASWGAQGVLGRILGMKSWFVGHRWTSWWGQMFDFLSVQQSSDFCLIFGCILEWFCTHFGSQPASKMGSEIENVCFWFWASRVSESSI